MKEFLSEVKVSKDFMNEEIKNFLKNKTSVIQSRREIEDQFNYFLSFLRVPTVKGIVETPFKISKKQFNKLRKSSVASNEFPLSDEESTPKSKRAPLLDIDAKRKMFLSNNKSLGPSLFSDKYNQKKSTQNLDKFQNSIDSDNYLDIDLPSTIDFGIDEMQKQRRLFADVK